MGAVETPVGENLQSWSTGLEGRDCVPFFVADKDQIRFEFYYLIVIFIAASLTLTFLQLFGKQFGLIHSDKIAFFSVLGGFLGGWVYDAKWFYRVTARGKNNQYGFPWQPHKFYWRVLTPFLAAVVAFATYMLVVSEILPIVIKHKSSARAAFAFSFVLGYFSDLVLSRMAAWAEGVLPKGKNEQNKL